MKTKFRFLSSSSTLPHPRSSKPKARHFTFVWIAAAILSPFAYLLMAERVGMLLVVS